MGLKGGISIDADSGPLGYVLWCCGSESWDFFTFIQICSSRTVWQISAENDFRIFTNLSFNQIILRKKTITVWPIIESGSKQDLGQIEKGFQENKAGDISNIPERMPVVYLMIQLSAIISWNTFFSLKILTARRKLKQKKVGLSYHIISLDFSDINFEKTLRSLLRNQ